MQVRWGNLIALGMVIIATVIGISHQREIRGFVATMTEIGPGHSPEEQIVGLLAFGLSAVIILAALKIVLNSNGRQEK